MTNRENTYSVPVPEVSLLTSWRVLRSENVPLKKPLPGIRESLAAGIRLLDLYFLAHEEIPWYAYVGGVKKPAAEPHEFVAGLDKPQLDKIAVRLRQSLVESYRGVLVGPRPRFAAIATFFPSAASVKNKPARKTAAKALINTMYLARKLGCSCVELVGGTGALARDVRIESSIAAYRNERLSALARTIAEVYKADLVHGENGPLLAVELEPGESFLLNSLGRFRKLKREVRQLGSGNDPYLNVDIGHAFMIGYTPEDLKPLKNRIAHFHISDIAGEKHEGDHSADLPPNTYHGYRDYKPWLELAIELTAAGREYSRSVAVEMEAANDLPTVLGAIERVRFWLNEVAGKMSRADAPHKPVLREGAILVVDIGHSTESILSQKNGFIKMENHVARLCRTALDHAGSVMSFTGDGLIAFFDSGQFMSTLDAAQNAFNAATGILSLMLTVKNASVRAALHWGKAYIPSSGELNSQIIGVDVVCGTRLCDWLAKTVEEAVPPRMPAALIGATETFVQRHGPGSWKLWGQKPLKGLQKAYNIYYPKNSDIPFLHRKR